MNSPENDDLVSAALQDWHLNPVRDPHFRTAVWTRIEAARRGVPWTGYVRAHATMLVGALAVALAIGGWVGREQAREQVAADRAQIASAYVQSLDARAMAMP